MSYNSKPSKHTAPGNCFLICLFRHCLNEMQSNLITQVIAKTRWFKTYTTAKVNTKETSIKGCKFRNLYYFLTICGTQAVL